MSFGDTAPGMGFDMQAAWLRRFSADTESNLKAFALRLKEALPDRVTVQEKKGFFAKTTHVVGVVVEMDEHHYILELANGRLKASIAMIVRGITLNTKSLDPAEWFLSLSQETKKATEHAKSLSQSLAAFMAS
jgi:hypothetical protein